MSTIKVNCPSCKAALKIAEEKLQATQGRVVCHECQHIFRLVKKSKKAQQTPPKRPVFEDVGTTEDMKLNDFPTDTPVSGSLKKSPHADPVFPTDGFPEEPKPKPKTKAKPFAKQWADLPPEQAPLHYRIPKAEAKLPFADVNQQNPVAFNLLDYKTANQQVPNVSINPPATVQAANGDKNNITIHTGSLVFTLTSDGQASASNTLPAENKVLDNTLSVQQAAAIAAASSRTEMNWTIATVAALIVLIVQLFYLVLMMS